MIRHIFPDFPREMEVEFNHQYNLDSARISWSAAIIAQFLYMAFYFWDRVIDLPSSFHTLMIRIVVTGWFFVVVILPHAVFVKYLQLLFIASISIAGIGVVTIISLLKDGLTLGLGGVVLVLMFNFGFFRLLFLPSLLSGFIVCVFYNLVAVYRGLPTPLMIANNFFLVSALVSGGSVTYLLERLFRTNFLRGQEIDRKSYQDTHYLEWLRSLATFLRHEVRQPVAQINSSIELVDLISNSDPRLAPHLSNASLGAQHVWNLIERASRATDAEAFVRQSQLQLIDLWRLLVEHVDAFKETYSGLRFHVNRSDKTILAYVDPTLIKEAIGNILSNSASYALEESTVEVIIATDDACITIHIDNKGPLVPDDTESLFSPFSSTRTGASSEHHGLGLYLVRLIAEHHRGGAALANLEDRSGVRASIWLPLPDSRAALTTGLRRSDH
jgi:signal transduction histidine kinase